MREPDGSGGGGGDGGAAAREAARQARIKTLQSDIRKRFFKVDAQGNITDIPTDARTAQLNDVADRTRNFFIPDFNQNTRDAQRELGFALARRGTTGGSAQIDAQRRLNDQIRLGERQIGTKVVNARTSAEQADQQLLNSLLSEATADPNAQGVLSGIKGSQLVNANQAINNSRLGAIDNVFANVGTLFKGIQDTHAFNQGSTDAAKIALLLGRGNQNPSINTNKAFSGNIS